MVEDVLKTDPAYQGINKEDFVKNFALRVFKIAGFSGCLLSSILSL
jgi:spore maturation protein CgeB